MPHSHSIINVSMNDHHVPLAGDRYVPGRVYPGSRGTLEEEGVGLPDFMIYPPTLLISDLR